MVRAGVDVQDQRLRAHVDVAVGGALVDHGDGELRVFAVGVGRGLRGQAQAELAARAAGAADRAAARAGARYAPPLVPPFVPPLVPTTAAVAPPAVDAPPPALPEGAPALADVAPGRAAVRRRLRGAAAGCAGARTATRPGRWSCRAQRAASSRSPTPSTHKEPAPARRGRPAQLKRAAANRRRAREIQRDFEANPRGVTLRCRCRGVRHASPYDRQMAERTTGRSTGPSDLAGFEQGAELVRTASSTGSGPRPGTSHGAAPAPPPGR